MNEQLLAVLSTAGLALVPGLEVRAAIPVGVAMGLSTTLATAIAVGINLLQIPVAFFFVGWAYGHLCRHPSVRHWLERTERAAGRYAGMIRRWGWLGLALFVIMPLPGTGIWGGVVVSRLLQAPTSVVWLGTALGVAVSGMLVALITQGALGAFRLFS